MVDRSDTSIIFSKTIVRGKFFFLVTPKSPKRTEGAHFFTFDENTIYNNFCEDFGPVSLATIYRFNRLVDKKLHKLKDTKKKMYFYTDHSPKQRTNAVFLIGAYCILNRGHSPVSVYEAFKPLERQGLIVGYRDASVGEPTHRLSLLDCFTALYKAKRLKLINLATFNVKEYEYYEQVENGDLNWIIPGKLLAFCSPVDDTKEDNMEDDPSSTSTTITHPPERYIPYFKENGINTVVRLNFEEYDKNKFVKAGINHHDMYFVDGSTPPKEIVDKFLTIAETAIAEGAIAVHCKAGLGRTGTLNACYLMKHYGFTAREAMAYTRIQRPGSIIGPQQHFLEEWEKENVLHLTRTREEELDATYNDDLTEMEETSSGEEDADDDAMDEDNNDEESSDKAKSKDNRLTGRKRRDRSRSPSPEPIPTSNQPRKYKKYKRRRIK